jgi:anti-sigma-K factor RskA
MAETHEREELATYALGLLEGNDLARVEEHLRSCPVCSEELQAYRSTIDVLPEALPLAQAPNDAWRGISDRIQRSRRGERAGAGSWLGRALGFGGRLQPTLTAVLVVAVLGLFGWNAWLQSRLSDNNSALDSVVSEWRGNATVVTLVSKPGVTGVSGRLVMSGDRQEGGLIVGGMPALSQGQSYEIWFVRSDQSRTPADTFTVDSQGQAVFLVNVPQPADNFDGVAITAEPATGSATPTGPDVLAGLIYGRAGAGS